MIIVPQILFIISKPIFDMVNQFLRDFRACSVVTRSVISFVFGRSIALGNNQDLETNHIKMLKISLAAKFVENNIDLCWHISTF